MKILLITERAEAVKSYTNILRQFKLEVSAIVMKGEVAGWEKVKTDLSDSVFKAVIVDRIAVDMTIIQNKLGVMDAFFILDDWSKLGEFKEQKGMPSYRFYMWPVNYLLLVDDINSICRYRDYVKEEHVMINKSLTLDLNAHAISNGIKSKILKNKEFELLAYFVRNKGRVISRINILESVWDMNSQIVTNTVDVHVSKVRKILREEFGEGDLIRTIPCYGYQLI